MDYMLPPGLPPDMHERVRALVARRAAGLTPGQFIRKGETYEPEPAFRPDRGAACDWCVENGAPDPEAAEMIVRIRGHHSDNSPPTPVCRPCVEFHEDLTGELAAEHRETEA